jgi:hypothetical protein
MLCAFASYALFWAAFVAPDTRYMSHHTYSVLCTLGRLVASMTGSLLLIVSLFRGTAAEIVLGVPSVIVILLFGVHALLMQLDLILRR